ncbi:hypothetical protein SEA_A3WALLY_328 [Microbacterium phage A3Wally]|nr:hypothetical protein SEA_A3WALLY_328 [Microbacterium phage A3Wally]
MNVRTWEEVKAAPMWGDIAVEYWTRHGDYHVAAMRFGSRSDMIKFDWTAFAAALGYTHGRTLVRHLRICEWIGKPRETLTSTGWRETAVWIKMTESAPSMVWRQAEDQKAWMIHTGQYFKEAGL